MNGKERRQSPRFQVWVPVQLQAEGEAAQAHLHDISRSGGFLTSERTWPAETLLELELPPLGAAESITVSARVVRVIERSGTDPAHGMAVRFTDVSAATSAWLDRILGTQA